MTTRWVSQAILKHGASLYFVMNQCFGGGFLDDLAPLGGTQSVMTAARHAETASYGSEAPAGVDLDSTDTFIRAMADGRIPAERVAREAVALNPFGPNPDTPRIGEEAGSEHAQYLTQGGGDGLVLADHAQDGLVILWAGQPAERDGIQMTLMIDRLVAMGYARSRIWLLYAGGEAAGEHPVVRAHMKSPDDAVNLLAATRDNLVTLVEQAFSGSLREPSAGQGQSAGIRPAFVFLYVGDHGGLDERTEAKRRFGRADTLVTPELDALRPDAQRYGLGYDAFR